MPVKTILRTNSGSWMALPLMVLAVAFAMGYMPATGDGYPIAIASSAMISLVFVAPICGALGAWEAARFRRALWWGLPHARPQLVIALFAVGPVILAGSIAGIAAMSAKLVAEGYFGLGLIPDLRLVVVTVAVIASHAMVGFAIGLWVPIVVAAPGVLIASFIWMAFSAATEPLWLRHLNGSLATCCLVQYDLAPNAVGAALVFAIGLMLGAAILIVQERARPGRSAIAIVPFAAASLVAASLAGSLGPDPVVARDETGLVCAGEPGSVEVCVWPEHATRLDETVGIAVRAIHSWKKARIEAPSRLTEGKGGDGKGLSFGLSLGSTEADIIGSLAYALLPGMPECAATGPYPAAEIRDELYAWYASLAGMSDEELDSRLGSRDGSGRGPRGTVAVLRQRSAEVQFTWVRGAIAAVSSCDDVAFDIPGQ